MHLRYQIPFAAQNANDEWLADLPNRLAVFALFPAAREGVAVLPYIGRTNDLRRRLTRLLSTPRQNSRLLNLREITNHIEYDCVGSAFEGTWLLYKLNRHFYARQYRERMRLKPPAMLKLKMKNRFPRCYPTRKIIKDGSTYYGPFASMAFAERFAGEFLDFFKIRRCVEELTPDPSHPGCIYSQLHMCLAPCFGGCTDAEYESEVQRVMQFLDSQGTSLMRSFESDRAQASEQMEFEQASKIHQKIEKLNDLMRQRSDLARNIRDLHAVMVLPAAGAKEVVFFRLINGEIHGPATLSLDENVSNPMPLDRQLQDLMAGLGSDAGPEAHADAPPWEHLTLLARWYYSSFRQGEIVMLNPDQAIPHSRLIRLCRKIVIGASAQTP
jgi:excinuclease ABC subunit C